MPDISLYIPTKNSQGTLEACLHSIRKQRLKPKEVIIIDGGSADRTLDIAKKYKIRVVRQHNHGLADARNLAYQNLKSPWIASLDSDCSADPVWLSELYKAAAACGFAGVCGRLVQPGDGSIGRWRRSHLRQDWGEERVVNPDFIFGSNNLIRRDAIIKAGGYDLKYATNYEDVDLSCRLRSKGFKIGYEPGAVCTHLRADSLGSLLATAKQWMFHSYPLPDRISVLAKRLFIYNPHNTLCLIGRDVRKREAAGIIISFLYFAYSEAYDIGYYLKNG